MRLADVVTTSEAVRATRSRSRKVDLLAECLRRAGPGELPVAVLFLAGRTRQGKVDVGWRTLRAVDAPPAAEASLGVGDADRALAELARVSGQGSRARRDTILGDLLARATRDEQAWLRDLVLGELRQGALDGVVAQALARAWQIDDAAVRRALMLSGSLDAVAAAAAEGGQAALAAFRLRIFRPLQPMLAQTSADVADAFADLDEALVDVKFDGTRVQVHRSGDEVRVYSRSLRDVTDELPAVVDAVRALAVDSVVLDGEALSMRADGRPLPFQETMRALGESGDGALRPFFFDCLHCDGEDLLDAPLAVRRQRLEQVVGRDALVPARVVGDAGAGAALLAEVLAAGHEGVMVKALGSPYEAGRRGASWRKVKPVHTLDLVVLAAEWGSGRRRGWLSNLHLGALDGDGFVMLGKTFKGLTDELLEWQTQRFLALETRREGHIVHIRPEAVVEIAFDGIQQSSRYPGGLALRFARVKRYRDDKAAHEADTMDTLRAIHRGDRLPRI